VEMNEFIVVSPGGIIENIDKHYIFMKHEAVVVMEELT